jgi:hypothetical protein
MSYWFLRIDFEINSFELEKSYVLKVIVFALMNNVMLELVIES